MASLGLIANYGSDEEDSSYTDSDDNASNSVTLVELLKYFSCSYTYVW